MKKTKILWAALLAGLTLVSVGVPIQAAPVEVMDSILAIVNDEVITRNELRERVTLALMQLERQGTKAPPRGDLERQLLDRMINDRVQVQHAKEIGVRVEEADLDRSIDRIAQDNKINVEELRTLLKKDGVPYEKFREDLRQQIIVSRLREKEVDDKIVITESEVDNLINNTQNQVEGAGEFDASHILVRLPENASPEQINIKQQRAEQALLQLKKGEEFKQIAATFSEAPDALQGGNMGWKDGERLPVIFFEALKSMKPGELSAVLRSPNGFHVLKLNDRRGGQAPVIVQQTHARHILIKASELVTDVEARARLAKLKERIENKTDFAELARSNSEDTSAAKGGELGWLSPGDTVPDFERAMDGLAVGQVSEAVRSPFGWHLIQVLERRRSDMSKESRRLSARKALHERKSDEALEEWVRQLRDRAFVEKHIDD